MSVVCEINKDNDYKKYMNDHQKINIALLMIIYIDPYYKKYITIHFFHIYYIPFITI